ncbi:MAG: restriction endonuclease subunit S [Planctomycetota bacterium]
MSNPDFWGGAIPWVSPKDMKRTRLWAAVDHVTVKALKGGARLAPAHSLLLVVRGMILAHTFPVARAEVSLAFNQDLKALIPRSDVDSEFLLWWLVANEAILLAITAESTHGTKRMPMDGLQAVEIDLPSPTEQRAIAVALNDVDALVEGLTRLIAKKRELKQAAMQQLLTGQTRLPGFHGEWEVKRLEEVGDIRSGGTPSTAQPHFWDGHFPWCTPTDITGLDGRKYLTETARTISQAGLKSSSAEVIPPRSLIMTSRATIGECAINLVPMTTNQGFKNLVPFESVDVEFLYYMMTTQKNGLMALCGGSTFLEISKKQLSVYEISIPGDRVEQVAIAAVLSDMDAELSALEARRDKTRALKQAMMQELLTGKTRLV